MKLMLFLVGVFLYTHFEFSSTEAEIIGKGQMPSLSKDAAGVLHLVYGIGDSILYRSSTDAGETFSSPVLVSRIEGLATSHTRGPQIAATQNGVLITACNSKGNIFSFLKEGASSWKPRYRVNDVDTVARENLMALSADGNNAFAVWLDLRNGRNQIYGSRSVDGGKTWSKNIRIYASPDSTVCECCKPSVILQGSRVYVMFRNWLGGNRDMYLIRSADLGKTFGPAQKLGRESWALNACPMDGGGIALQNGVPQTVWNRKSVIYTVKPGAKEMEIGKGRSCTIETLNDKNIFAWVDKGDIVLLKPTGEKLMLGKGQLPILKAASRNSALCVWEDDKQIYKMLIAI